MTRITFLLIFTLLISFSSSALALSITGKNKLDQIIITLLKENILDDRYNDSPKIGEIICKAYGGGSRCNEVHSIGQAICKAGGGSRCWEEHSIGQAICKAGGGSRCWEEHSINEGLNKLPTHDIDWAWDLVLHCRGIQTGQFAKLTKCAGKSKNDDRWPNK